MNTEKIEKLKKGLTNSQIPESLREKIRQQISRLEAEDKANEPAPKEEAMPKKEVTPKVAKATTVRKTTVRKPTVRKPRAKKVLAPKTTTAGKTTAMSLAKEIRKDGEKWTDAVKRAGMQMKKGTTEVKKSTKTEMQKLLALVKRRKELKGISGTNLKRDSQRKAKPKGKRVSENGKVYYENRDNRTDRLAPNYPKNAPLLELGGTVVTDLAGNTSGGDLGLNAGMPLSGFSNTAYTGLVGETGAMSSGEMFKLGGKLEGKKNQINMLFKNQGIKEVIRKEHVDSIRKIIEEDGLSTKGISDDEILMIEKEIIKELSKGKMELGGGLPSGSEQHYVNYYLGSGTAQGIFEHGGGVESVPRKEYIEFVDYVNEFYGKDGIYADQLNGGFTKSQIKVAVVKYFSTFDKNRTWGGGDSLDRERVRVILDPSYKMEHGGGMHDYKKMEDNYANGGFMDNVYAGGGEIRRFNRQEQMDSETREEVLDTLSDPDLSGALTNYLYGLFDGYDYSETENFQKEMRKLKSKDMNLYDRVNRLYKKIDMYKFEKYDNYAKGGGIRIKNGQTYDYGRVWTNDHNQFDKGAEHEVNYRK